MPGAPKISTQNHQNAAVLQGDVASLLAEIPQAVAVFLRHGMACVGCSMAKFETLQDAARIYGLDPESLLNEMEKPLHRPAGKSNIQPGVTMTETSTFFNDLLKTVEVIPPESIVSRTILQDGDLKVILFGFDAGQTLSEHTASVPAIIHIVEGECDITLGGEKHPSSAAGAWMHMPARMPHSILAKTPLRMLLLMLPPQV
jgi:hybrid cluster-associated redox disulfide protein